MGLSDFLFGKKNKWTSTLDKNQQQALSGLLQQLQGMTGQGGNYAQSQNYLGSLLGNSPEAYEQFAAPYRTEFQEKTLPGIAERFAGLGGGLGGGAMGSSGFGQALGGAANQFQSNLSGLFANIRNQAAGQAMNQYGGLLSQGLGQYQAYQPGSTGFLGGIGAGAAQGFGQGGGMAGMMKLFQSLGLV